MSDQVKEPPEAEDTAQKAAQETTQETKKEKRTFVEEVEVAGSHLVDRIKELVQDSNARRVIIRGSDGHEIMTVPLTLGVVAGGLITLSAPLLAALGALAALVSRVKLQVIREHDEDVMEAEKVA